MKLIPIGEDDTKNAHLRSNPECVTVLDVYPLYYQMIGYHLPWIGYFVTFDGKEIVGCGGYKGQPKDGKVEIAYTTFKAFEGKGIGKEICRQLVLLARETDPTVRITARTLRENNASTKILKHNGFVFLGIVMDPDDGEVWEWEYKS